MPGFQGLLPFLLEGPDADAFEAGGAQALAPEQLERLDEEQLLKGILCGLCELDADGRLVLRRADIETMRHLLEVLRQGYQFDDTEQMALETAASLRGRWGARPSLAALSTGLLLVAGSSKIRADLIQDTWAVSLLCDAVADRDLNLRQIPAHFEGLDLDQLHVGTAETCVYFTLAARYLLGDLSELESFLVEHVVERVVHPELKQKVQLIVESDEPLTQAQLTVV